MRCVAHILNLVVNDGLRESCDSIEKIRNAVKYVKSSPSRLGTFKKITDKLKLDTKTMLSLDVPTRWSSTYLMLDSALNYQKVFEVLAKDHLSYKLYFKDDDQNSDGIDGNGAEKKGRKIIGPPESFDFQIASVLLKFLKLFYDVTCKLSGSTFVTSNACYSELCVIERNILNFTNSGDHLLKTMAVNMKLKYDKYWGTSIMNNLLIYMAVVLDPRKKLKYISFCFHKLMDNVDATVMVAKVESALRRLHDWFAIHTSDVGINGQSSQAPQPCARAVVDKTQSVTDFDNLEEEFNITMHNDPTSGSDSELDMYLKECCVKAATEFDILGWWKHEAYRYTMLSQVAQTVLVVPVTTVASESCFSTGGRILDAFRSSLSPSTVQALICAQNWLRTSGKGINLKESMEFIAAYEEYNYGNGDDEDQMITD